MLDDVFNWVIGFFVFTGLFAWLWCNIIGGIVKVIPSDDKGLKIDFRND